MNVTGYGFEAEWDGGTLRARGTNRMNHKALAGDLAHEGDLLIDRDEMARVSYKAPKRVTNGLLNIRTKDGRRVQLHFLKKHADQVEALARELGAEV